MEEDDKVLVVSKMTKNVEVGTMVEVALMVGEGASWIEVELKVDM